VIPVGLDITNPDRVMQVAADCDDVSLLINNAGILEYSTFTSSPGIEAARAEMETNYFGTLSMCRAFARFWPPTAAAWSLTNGIRLELHHQGTLVVAVHAGFIDTDMAAIVNNPKDSPEDVARQALDGVEAGQPEVLADERTRTVKANLSRDHELIYPAIQEFWDDAIKGNS